MLQTESFGDFGYETLLCHGKSSNGKNDDKTGSLLLYK